MWFRFIADYFHARRSLDAYMWQTPEKPRRALFRRLCAGKPGPGQMSDSDSGAPLTYAEIRQSRP